MGCHHACAFLALLLIFGDTHNFLFAEDTLKIVQCVDSGQTVGGTTVMYPADATPTNCTASGPTKGLQCRIGNYKKNHPDACKDVTERLQSRAVATPPRLDEVCQPQLTNLNLYKLSCRHLASSPQVSLNFTFELPLCAAEFANASTAVKVDFNANRDHPQNYFQTHPICRLFNYTGSDFSHISDFSQKITMFYEWMAVGIQDRSSYPAVVYYLSLTADPSAAQLNYTVVYLDVSSQSMRLVAGAWRSNGRAHFIFLPIDHVNNYRIEATSVGQAKWEHSEEVKVTPTDRDICDRLGYPYCAPITITLLDKNTLNLPVEPLHPVKPGVKWRHILVITVGSLVAGVLIAATIAVLRRHQGRPAKPEGYEPAPEAPDEQREPRQVLTITSLPESVYEEVLLDLLTHHGFKTDPLRDAQCKSRMRNNKPILLIIHPHMINYPAWQTFVDLVLYISENKPLWRRVRVISLEDQGEVCRLQDLFPGLEGIRPRLNEFWTNLKERTHELRTPDDGETLIAQLNEVYAGERPAVQVHNEEEEEAISLISSSSDIFELGQRNSRDFGINAEEEEPERANRSPCCEVKVNVPDRHAHYVVFHQAVPENEGEGHDLKPQSEVGASGVSTISDPQELVGQINGPVSVEIHFPTHEPSHFAASDEGHHVPQGPHLNPNDDNEISDGLNELRFSAVPPQRLPPDGSDASPQPLPTLERGDGPDPDETTPKVLFSRDPAWEPEHLRTTEDMSGNVQINLSALPSPEPLGGAEIEKFPPGESPTDVLVNEGRDGFESCRHVPHFSLLLPSSGSVVSREETENREQIQDASAVREGEENREQVQDASAVREGEENSYHSSLGPPASSLSGVRQPCYDDRARGDNDHNSANGYSPSAPWVCGPNEYMSMLSQRSLGPGGNSVAGPLEEFNAGIGIVDTRNLSLEEAAVWESDDSSFFPPSVRNGPDRAAGFKAGAEQGNFHVPLTLNDEILLLERGGRQGEQPMPDVHRYDGYVDEQGERAYELDLNGDMCDNEQRERNVRGNGNVDDNGQSVFVLQAPVVPGREAEEHAESIDEDDDPDSGVAWNPDSIESQDSQ
ncbi:uncharacterized protein [Littorina saxatilis]|uniref:uncharacterized protein isoform X2 n=1 Tax=Littorina saxatilis TaxID=31220 RepID=UPI0038B59918